MFTGSFPYKHIVTLYVNLQNQQGIGRLWHIGLGFLKFSHILYYSDGKIREKVV